MSERDRSREGIWVTGVGAVTPLGHEIDTIADNLIAGKSAVRVVDRFPVAEHPSQIAAQLDCIPCPTCWDSADFAARRPIEQVTLWCLTQALRDAGLWERRRELRVGVVLGLGAEWLILWEAEASAGKPPFDVCDPTRFPIVQRMQDALGLVGPTMTLSAACASGNFTLELGRRWIEQGWCDVCLAGGCDMPITPISLASFGNLRALSRRNAEPSLASRPFDRGRDGFVMGEGGVVFLLESASSARRRDARVYGAVAGCGASSDAFHPVIPSPDPRYAAEAMRQALDDAHVAPDQIGYVNAHATSTPIGDAIEAAALRAMLGDAAAHTPVSSTKSMTGHLVTAAGAFEALACLVAIQRQAVPPTINLDDLDPECAGLRHVANEAIDAKIRSALSNSFGFGGSNNSLVLTAV